MISKEKLLDPATVRDALAIFWLTEGQTLHSCMEAALQHAAHVSEVHGFQDVPGDWTVEIRYEGGGASTLIPGDGEGTYRAFIGPWDAHASECYTGYGDTREAALQAALQEAREDT